VRVIFPGREYLTFPESKTSNYMKGKIKISIQGQLDKNWKNSFEGMNISYEGDNTILTGQIKDEAHLHGILNILAKKKPILTTMSFILNIALHQKTELE
jgi:hypothetical protein